MGLEYFRNSFNISILKAKFERNGQSLKEKFDGSRKRLDFEGKGQRLLKEMARDY